MNEIYYNDKNAFSGISYTPYVSFSRESDGWFNAENAFSIEGEIICCGESFNQVIDKKNNLLKNFSENFKKFEIKQGASTLLSYDHAFVEDITFEDSDYAYRLPYTINIRSFDKNSFSGSYYITDPEDSFNFESDENKLINISHTVSAKGINTNNTAIQNACNWVYSRTGIKNIKPFFITMHAGVSPILNSISENIDRINGTCSVEESYLFDQAHQDSGVLRYTTQVSQDSYDFTNVTIRGSIDGGMTLKMQDLRNRFKSLDTWSLAFDNYQKATKNKDLNNIIIDSDIEEDLKENRLNFIITYNNDNSPLVNVISKASVSIGYNCESSEFTASIDSEIKCRSGKPSQRQNLVNDYFNKTFNAISEFNKNIDGVNSIISFNISNFKLKSEKIKFNEKNQTISYNAVWDINLYNASLPNYIENISFSATKTYGKQEYSFQEPLCGDWLAYKKYQSKNKFTIQGVATLSRDSVYADAVTAIKVFVQPFNKGNILKEETFENDLNNSKINFTIIKEDN